MSNKNQHKSPMYVPVTLLHKRKMMGAFLMKSWHRNNLHFASPRTNIGKTFFRFLQTICLHAASSEYNLLFISSTTGNLKKNSINTRFILSCFFMNPSLQVGTSGPIRYNICHRSSSHNRHTLECCVTPPLHCQTGDHFPLLQVNGLYTA